MHHRLYNVTLNVPYVTVLAKTRIVRTRTEFNFNATVDVDRHTQYLSIPSVSSVKILTGLLL